MRILLLSIFLLAFQPFSTAQNSKTKALLKEIEGQWSQDDNGNVTYKKVIEAPDMSKDEIYNRVENYFVYNYGNGKSVIQVQNKDQGNIVGKGIFTEVHTSGVVVGTISFDCWHIARVDVKEGKARVLLTLTEFIRNFEGNGESSSHPRPVNESFPINPDGKEKNKMGQVFYDTHQVALATLESIEKAILEGFTSSDLEGDDW